jgi:hypothetical protein
MDFTISLPAIYKPVSSLRYSNGSWANVSDHSCSGTAGFSTENTAGGVLANLLRRRTLALRQPQPRRGTTHVAGGAQRLKRRPGRALGVVARDRGDPFNRLDELGVPHRGCFCPALRPT